VVFTLFGILNYYQLKKTRRHDVYVYWFFYASGFWLAVFTPESLEPEVEGWVLELLGFDQFCHRL